MDTGDILLQEELPILPGETAGELIQRMAPLGAALLIETIRLLEKGECPRRKQDESQMSYYPMLNKEMGEVDWRRTAHEIVCQARGLSPWPCAYTAIGGETLKLWRVEEAAGGEGAPGAILCADPREGLVIQAGEQVVRVLELQAQGGKRMPAKDYLRGHPLKASACDQRMSRKTPMNDKNQKSPRPSAGSAGASSVSRPAFKKPYDKRGPVSGGKPRSGQGRPSGPRPQGKLPPRAKPQPTRPKRRALQPGPPGCAGSV